MKKRLIIISVLILVAALFIVPFVTRAQDVAELELVNNDVQDYYAEGDEFTVQVNFKNPMAGAETLGGAINFDEDKLDVVSVTPGIASMFYRGPNPTNQIIMLYASFNQGTTLNPGTLGTVRFVVKPGATGSTQLYFYNVEITDTDATISNTASTNSLTINFATPLEAISLSTTKDTIGTGEQTTISVTYDPDNTTDSKSVTWTSSDESIATVDNTGKVTGQGPGTATITATSAVSGVSPATIDITVVSELQSISLNKSSMDISKTENETLTVNYIPTNTTSNKGITWTSSDESVATVDSSGEVHGVNYGTATITATSVVPGIAPATCTVTVSNHLESIELSETSFELNKNANKALTVTYNAENPADPTTDNTTVIWSSSDETVATVDSSGEVHAVGKGTATITANVAGVPAATATVTVVVPLESIELGDDFSLQPGSSKNVTVTYTPTDADDKTLAWSSSNEGVATVTNGNVTAVAPGTAVITASQGSITDTVTVTVTEIDVETVVISEAAITIEKGEVEGLTASYLPTTATNPTAVTWSSDDETIATVDSNGNVTGVSGGTTTIKATISGITATCEVTVVVPLTSIVLDEEEINLNKTATTTVGYTINPGDTTDENPVVWSSQNTTVATVDSNTGVITAVAPGTAIIEVRKGSKSDTLTVNVKSPLTAISIKANTSLLKNQTETLTVTYTDPDTTDSKAITWTSSDETVATVDANGKVTAKKAGTATITATSAVAGVAPATCSVTVTEVNMTGVEISNVVETLPKGNTHTLEALVTPEDTTDDYDLEWTSSDEAIATEDASGKVTAIAPGTVIITLTATTNDNAGQTFSDEIEIEVVEIPMTGVNLSSNKYELSVGDTANLSVGFLPTNTTDPRNVTFASSDEGILTVDANGKITAKAPGKAIVTVIAANGMKSQVEITVTQKAATSDSATPNTSDIVVRYLILLVLSMIAVVTVIKIRKSHVVE